MSAVGALTPVIWPSPVGADVEVVSAGPSHAVTTVEISPEEQVFAGHYPGFPIFPGVCVVECVVRSARLVPAAPGLRLAAVESTRFSTPVFPGDTLTIELDWQADGPDWRCRAEVCTARGPAAQVRLRYETGEDRC
ncbi:MAG: hypothetical protein J2P26_04600 [Nocardiopsaceae bacterium]|nr:hypothetical protein [Nocardiopsaceae bacterium]